MIGSGSLPFDCNAAINNFFRVAWPVLTDAPSVRECAWVVDMYSIRSYAPSLPGKTGCEAWSPEKKHWCCTKQGKGCEGHHPPSVDAGYGMVWKHVQAGARSC